MTRPEVTIAVPTYQGAEFLAAALESAVQQTAWDRCELVVCDDGSDDDTVAIARSFAAEHPRVRVEQNPTRLGLVGNWNRVIEHGAGNWIKFLFQDDLLAPDCVARMLEAAADQPALVVCGRQFEFASGTPEATKDYLQRLPDLRAKFGEGDDGGGVPAAAVCEALLDHPGTNLFGEPPTVMVHRQRIGRYGGFRDALIQLCDLEFVARVGCAEGLVYVPAPLATFRVHGGAASATNLASRQFRKDVLDTLILFHEFAFAPAFAPLRAAARARSISLGAWAAKELHRAQRDARAAKAAGDSTLQEQLDEVCTAHPALANRLWSSWHRIRKQFRNP